MKTKKNNKGSKFKQPVKSVIEVTDFKQAVILRYSGHNIDSISKDNKGPTSHIYRFDFRNDTLPLLADLPQRTLLVEPSALIDSVGDLLAHKIWFVGSNKKTKKK